VIKASDALARLRLPAFPRTSAYDPEWIVRHQMGPHPLWLLEWLTGRLSIEPRMRVLDLGCGSALTSIFLAREFGARVWAADLWVDPTSNWKRIREAGVADLVAPIRVEAHELPFADGFFDAVVSIDAYHYFGTDDLYLGWYLRRLLAPGGRIGIVVPGLREEVDQVPSPLAERWDPEFWSFHSPEWWRRQWERSAVVDVEVADLLPDGWSLWMRWAQVLNEVAVRVEEDVPVPSDEVDDVALLEADTTRLIGFTRVIAQIRPITE
jgi:SAM-dependent methyltransferase